MHLSTTSRLSSIATLAVAAVLATTLGVPAQAAARRFDDPRDPGRFPDLRAAQLRNGVDRVVVTTRYTDLRRDPSSGAGGAVYLDTDPRHRGPEFVFVGGYYEGTDYQLLHTSGFGARAWGAPVKGAYRMRVDYAAETVRMAAARAALGYPDAIRIAVRASGPHSVDWLGEPRSLTPWVSRG